MRKVVTSYTRFGTVHTIDGVEVSEEELERYFRDQGRPSLEETLATEEGRRGLVTAMSRDNSVWQDGVSYACAVPDHMAADHAKWIKEQKLVGVTVLENGPHKGCINFAGPGNKEAYLKARGLVDASSGGAGSSAASTKAQPTSILKRARKL